jgi:tRNA(Arg) A34 adenosine deaminase TadA
MSRTPDFFDIARDTAAKSDARVTKYQHASVILDRKGRVIATGKNHFAGLIIETEDGGLINKTIHSEVHALQKVNIRRLTGATIINYGRTNVAAILSRPCDNCWAILAKLGFSKVIYTVRSSIDKPLWREESF